MGAFNAKLSNNFVGPTASKTYIVAYILKKHA